MDEALFAQCRAIAAENEAASGEHDRRITETIRALGLFEERPKPGETAPDFAIPEADGSLVALSHVIGGKGAVAIFVHGLWCPYCNAQLRAFSDAQDRLSNAGLSLVTVTPEVKGRAATLKDSLALSGPILCDVDQGVALAYGCLLRISDADRVFLTNQDIDLEGLYGNAARCMPLASIFLIDATMRVAAVFGNEDQRIRPGPETILAAAAEQG